MTPPPLRAPRHRAALLPVLAATAALVAGACGGTGSTTTATPDTRTVVETVTVRGDGTPYRPATALDWPAGSPFSPGGAATIVAGLPTAIGRADVRARWVAIYPEFVSVTVLDPVRPRQSDSWDWRDGVWDGPQPDANEDADQLRKEGFPLDPDDFAVVPQVLAESARLASDIEDAEIGYLWFGKSGIHDDRLVWRVSVGGLRESATYWFSRDGAFLQAT